jgi:hypothetical protein
MSNTADTLEARLRQSTTPPLPVDLKRRVMAAASLAPRAPWGDRAWYSGAWRLAAVGALLAILASDRWSGERVSFEAGEPAPFAAAERIAVTDIGREMGLPEDSLRELALRAEFVRFTARESAARAGVALR